MQIKTELLEHQKDAVEKLSKLKVGALYCEMGTGKTRMTLSLIKPRLDHKKVDAVLWLCPCSTKANLKLDLVYHCGEVPKEVLIYGIESLSSSDRLYLKLLNLSEKKKIFLVVDESSLVKNPAAIRTKRIIELSKKCPYKLILNGTPISKNEADLFTQWYILDWRILGYQSYYSFSANHLEFYTIRRPNGTEYVDKKRVRRVLNVGYLTKKIEPYTVQIKKEDCMNLPEKKYFQRYFSLPDEHAGIYEWTKSEYLDRVDEFREETIYKLFTALQHVSSGRRMVSKPYERMEVRDIYNTPQENPRIQCLFRAISEDIKDEKCIIFCKYQSEIDEIASVMDSRKISYTKFTGKIPLKKRQESINEFRGSVQFFLSNRSCGAYGLNLQFCHKIIYYSNDFDLATRLQSEDRVHRIGQTEEIQIYDIVADDTIDVFIADCLQRKERLVDAFKTELKKTKERKELKMRQINIGYSSGQKEDAIKKYLKAHPEVKHVIIFYPDKWEHLTIEAEYIPYSETIMYRTFYPLLEKIDNTYLLVYDEFMRTKKRTDLTYNCCHKYNNQTEHILVFEYFPFIENIEDFMILADLIDHVKMGSRKFDWGIFHEIELSVVSHKYNFTSKDVIIQEKEAYKAKKEELFTNLGKKDPDTIPNALEIFVGKWKKPEKGKDYIARNKRYKLDNVSTFKDAKPLEKAILIDLPLSSKDFSDWLKLSRCKKMVYLNTGLPVDTYFFDKYKKWLKEVKKFYETANLLKGKRS